MRREAEEPGEYRKWAGDVVPREAEGGGTQSPREGITQGSGSTLLSLRREGSSEGRRNACVGNLGS